MRRITAAPTTIGAGGARVVAVVLAAIVLAASCSGESASGPPEIAYGRDVCAECHMIISEPRFAAAYRVGEGEAFTFDDIGDLIAHATRSGDIDKVTAWVHDYDTEKWIDAPDAWFVTGSDVETPMAGGLVAFARRSDAEAFIEGSGGTLVQWPELIEAGAPSTGGTHGSSPGKGR